MEAPSPARLYATAVGAFLVVFGIAGFFFDLDWLNFLYVGSGAVGLLVAGKASRPYALAAGLLYTGLAIWSFTGTDGWLHLALGLLGLAAVVATPGPKRNAKAKRRPKAKARRRRALKTRPQAAAKRL